MRYLVLALILFIFALAGGVEKRDKENNGYYSIDQHNN